MQTAEFATRRWFSCSGLPPCCSHARRKLRLIGGTQLSDIFTSDFLSRKQRSSMDRMRVANAKRWQAVRWSDCVADLPSARQQHPEQPLTRAEAWTPCACSLQHRELMAQGNKFQQQVTALAEPCPRRRKPLKNPSHRELYG